MYLSGTLVCVDTSSIRYVFFLCLVLTCYAAGKITAGLAESNDSLPPSGLLIVTCGWTACTPGSAPGPTLGNEYGKPLPFTVTYIQR